jgi:uncharacterized protein (TIGR03437 family)
MRYFAALLLSAALVHAADLPFQDGQAAWFVLGQSPFSNGSVNSPATQAVLGGAGGVAWANGKLLVADSNRVSSLPLNNRVLIFDTPARIPNPHTDVSKTGNYLNTRCPVCAPLASEVLGQPDFSKTDVNLSDSGMRNPTAVATDGTVVAVADTDNNRVLIWTSFPTSNNQPANFVLGQPDFKTVQTFAGVTNKTLRGPQGVWIQNGKLFVADTQNHRVLIWNSIPTQNDQAADVVVGQKDFNTAYAPPAGVFVKGADNLLLSPASVTSDGTHLFVADLGYNRVLIWNGIPTSNDPPANVVIGQANMTDALPNNTPAVCAPAGKDSSGNPIYPAMCGASLNFPRFALPDGQGRLFIADSGNDRVLIFNSIPMTNGAAADNVLGQADAFSDLASDPQVQFASTVIPNRASTNTIRTPTSLAWDGTNLYVADPFDQRVMLFTPGENVLAPNSVLNDASLAIFQEGVVALGGGINANDTVSITINNVNAASTHTYTYTVQKTDTLNSVAAGLVGLINANSGDPNVVAVNAANATVLLNSRQSQLPNNSIALSASTSAGAQIQAVTSGSYLTGGNAAVIAPGTIVSVTGKDLTNGDSAGDTGAPTAGTALPTTLAGAQVFMDGNPAPLIYASPTQIRAQVPYTFSDSTSASIYVRTVHKDGSVTITNATGIIIAPANPGLFAGSGTEPRPGLVFHGGSTASTVVSVDGSVKAADTATITIAGKAYTYTVQSTDTTLAQIRDGLINLINANGGDPNVIATAGGQFARVVLTAKASGPAGNGISVTATVSSGAQVILTAYNSSTCCANTAGAPVTAGNPAVPGETIIAYATGLGLLNGQTATAGQPYNGGQPNSPTQTVSSTVNGLTGQVISAGLPTGATGVYAVSILLPSNLPPNDATQLYIAQDAFVSNIVTFPVLGTQSGATFTASPNPIVVPAGATAGQTTLNWNVPAASVVEIHLGSPSGALFATGGSTGSATTGAWVTDGSQFFLQDVSNGKALTTQNTIATVTVRVGTPQGLTTFTADPNPIPVQSGQALGATTLHWNAPTAAKVQIRLGSPDGALFAAGPSQGSAATGAWVGDGSVFYLQDASNADPTSAANTIGTLVVHTGTPSQLATLSASPDPILVSPGSIYGITTLKWNVASPFVSVVELHLDSPTGPLFAMGRPSGSATTGPWVTDGTSFYLVDASNGQTLASTIVHLQVSETVNVFTATPNPIPSSGFLGATTLTWSAPNSTIVQIHLGSPDGPLFAEGPSVGSAATSQWVTDGMVFYLQDVSYNQPLTLNSTLSTITVHLANSMNTASLTASPGPIVVPAGDLFGATTLSWNAPNSMLVEVHVGSPTGPLFAYGTSTGSAATGQWVTDGGKFYLQDVSNGQPASAANTIATATVNLIQLPQ